MEVIQFFLAEPGAEPAFLHALWEEVSLCSGIATYNGASFDLPLLRTRWVLARMPGELVHAPHQDLLTLTRALWKHRLESCTLRAVEERLLDFDRDEDLPGVMIPESYFGYLRRGRDPLLEEVLEHNRQDVISLYHLHLRVLQRLEGRDGVMDAGDWLALGRHLIRHGRRAAGWRALRCSAELREGPASAAAGLLIARRLQRLRRPESAERVLAWIQAALPRETGLAVARARLLEWRLRRPGAALDLVEAALRQGPPDALAAADLERRAARLRRRLEQPRRRRRAAAQAALL